MKNFDWEKIIFIALSVFMGASLFGSLVPLFGYTGKGVVILSKLPEPILMLTWIAFICGIVGLLGYFYYNNLLKKDGYSNEEESFYDQKENRIKIVKAFSSVCCILIFMVLGLPESNDLPTYYNWVMYVNIPICYLGALANNSLIKKVRPELEENLTGFVLNKINFEKLDEREKEKVGRASFKTMNLMGVTYCLVFLICFVLFGKSQVSPIICVTVGGLWFLQTVIIHKKVQYFHKCTLKRYLLSSVFVITLTNTLDRRSFMLSADSNLLETAFGVLNEVYFKVT